MTNDAGFALAYAIIMLNTDQHNHNVRKQNIPMTVEVSCLLHAGASCLIHSDLTQAYSFTLTVLKVIVAHMFTGVWEASIILVYKTMSCVWLVTRDEGAVCMVCLL